jgi:hypothetical protein
MLLRKERIDQMNTNNVETSISSPGIFGLLLLSAGLVSLTLHRTMAALLGLGVLFTLLDRPAAN